MPVRSLPQGHSPICPTACGIRAVTLRSSAYPVPRACLCVPLARIVLLFGLLLTCSVLAACTYSHDVPWRPTAALYAATVEAADAWCTTTAGDYCPDVAPAGEGRPIEYARLPDAQCGEYHGPDGIVLDLDACGTLHVHTYDGSRIATEHETLVHVIGHELGHAAGVWHIPCPALMCSPNTWITGVTPADVRALRDTL